MMDWTDRHCRFFHRLLTQRTLLQILWRYPLMTVQVITRIHAQAFRLWLKRVPHFKHVPQLTEETP